MTDFVDEIGRLWAGRDSIAEVMPAADAEALVREAVDRLDRGEARVAEVVDGDVVVHEWAKQAILLLFKLARMETIELGPFEYADKIPLKRGFQEAGVRVVPGASARWGSFLAPGVILMPSYVNIGGYVDEGTLVDTWATVGSCAQIGKRVHLSGGVGIGGVLEPPNAVPVVIEDDVFVGSRCMVVNGARIRRGAKVGAGLVLTNSTPVIEAETGDEVARGDIPERAVVVQGIRNREFPGGEFGLPCALILRYLEEGQTHDKLLLNEILREHGMTQ